MAFLVFEEGRGAGDDGLCVVDLYVAHSRLFLRSDGMVVWLLPEDVIVSRCSLVSPSSKNNVMISRFAASVQRFSDVFLLMSCTGRQMHKKEYGG